jgi:hypothetical protein
VDCNVGCVGCSGGDYGHGMPYEAASPHPAAGPMPAPAVEEPVPPSPQSQLQPRRMPPTNEASPVFSPDQARNNSYNRNTQNRSQGQNVNRTANSQPRLIGPVGYDVLD